jgi:ribosome assembly protein RRB1
MDMDESNMAQDQQQQQQQEQEQEQDNVKVYLPGEKLEEGEVLVADTSAYEMLHQMQVEWPCLSFDFLRDSLGSGRKNVIIDFYLFWPLTKLKCGLI